MMLPGQFDVSASGASTYSIPIAVPPGTGGMVPSLSLEYSSQSGDGIMGLGWSLAGLPSIGRCPRTVAQDGIKGSVNYNGDDRFCLEGQRLIAISGAYGANGTEYRTEIEGFSKIVSHGGSTAAGPAYFVVQTKSGQTMEFGDTVDSRFELPDGSAVRAWGISKVTDTVGNYLKVVYNENTPIGEAYPIRIEYTANWNTGLQPYNVVFFDYTSRQDQVPKYHAGHVMQSTVLLTNVRTYEGRTYSSGGSLTNAGTLVYDYRITYDVPVATSAGGVNRSRVNKIELCDGGSPASCLPPTTFTWQGTRDAVSHTAVVNPINGEIYPGSEGYASGDFDGDGLSDVTYPAAAAPPPTHSRFFQGTEDQSFPETNLSFLPNPTGNNFRYEIAIDLNADSLSDILAQRGNITCGYGGCGGGLWPGIYQSDGQGSLIYVPIKYDGVTLNGVPPSPQYTYAYDLKFWSDFNGDGRSDHITQDTDTVLRIGDGSGEFTSGSVHTGLQTSSIFVGDFDGNGCDDVLTQGSVNKVFYHCNPLISEKTVVDWLTGYRFSIGDFNGDGKADILRSHAAGTSTGNLFLSYGTGFLDAGFAVPAGWGKYQVIPSDLNGDGRTDLILVAIGYSGYYGSGTPHEFWLSTGTGFNKVGSADIANSSPYNNAVGGDWTNDGGGDLWIQPNTNGQQSSATTSTLYKVAFEPELIKTIDNGLGIVTTFTYDRLNKGGSLYTKNSDATYPQVDLIGPFYVVSKVESSDGLGTGGTYDSTYGYEGLKASYDGRGFLGFSKFGVVDPQTNVTQTTEFNQNWPYIGLASQETKYHLGNVLNKTLNTYAADDLGSGRRFVKLTETVQRSYDLNGAHLPPVTTTYQYDSYGNPTAITVSTPDGSSKTTTNTYTNDTTKWHLGRLTSANVTSTVSSGSGTAGGPPGGPFGGPGSGGGSGSGGSASGVVVFPLNGLSVLPVN